MSAEAASIPSHGMLACYELATVEHLPANDIALVLIGGLAWHALSDVAVGQWLERRQGGAGSLAMIAGLSVPIASAGFVILLLLAPHRPWAAMMVGQHRSTQRKPPCRPTTRRP